MGHRGHVLMSRCIEPKKTWTWILFCSISCRTSGPTVLFILIYFGLCYTVFTGGWVFLCMSWLIVLHADVQWGQDLIHVFLYTFAVLWKATVPSLFLLVMVLFWRWACVFVCDLQCALYVCLVCYTWFIHLAVCFTTGPKPLPNPSLHIVRSRASSFRC
jgi:hypothetical protein